MTTETTRYITVAGAFMHVGDRPTIDSFALAYDWGDFADEFLSNSAGANRWRVDEKLNKFLQHFGLIRA